MNLPRSGLKGLDPVAVRAANDTLMAFDLGLNRLDRLQRGYVGRLAVHMVNVQRDVMLVVSTVNATIADLVLSNPLLDGLRSSPSQPVQVLSGSRSSQVLVSVLPILLGRPLPRRPSPASAKIGAVLGRVSLGHEGSSALLAHEVDRRDVSPRFLHAGMVSTDDSHPHYPHDPDPLWSEAYEPVEEA